ncbi:hypothetical protein L1987_64316 [Smallanthus sonchifolius]|uniref:Uncharacterized protein n=1 Tax=Smallanthus sonchifolius TaxID=185202 RepID=A0ACB9CG08_9ASTR|nr:hypothetical protein L1987_64316 [Smallanthus sonchifolius]
MNKIGVGDAVVGGRVDDEINVDERRLWKILVFEQESILGFYIRHGYLHLALQLKTKSGGDEEVNRLEKPLELEATYIYHLQISIELGLCKYGS